jgi:selenocysteine lyase/cysteine desulfurase
MYNLNQLRSTEFPGCQESIYFSYATISLLPARTQAKVKWVTDEMARNPMQFWMTEGMAYANRFQQALATFVRAESPLEIVPASSTSSALNAVAQAVPWQPGDNLLFCEVEFPSNAFPWMSLARDGVEVRQVTADNGSLTLAALEPLVDERTRLVAVSALQFFTGQRADLTAVGQFCHERRILFAVDAIQAIGHMPIDVQAMNIDVLAAGGHKSLMSLPGLGFLYVRGEVAEEMRPRLISSNSTADFMHWLKYDLTPATAAQRFAGGTPNLPGIVALVESLGLIDELGIENIDRHTRQLAGQMTEMLIGIGYEVISPNPAVGPIVTCKLNMDSATADALIKQLFDRHVFVIKHLDRAGNPYLRASFHCYNTAEEVEKFGEILQEVVRNEK